MQEDPRDIIRDIYRDSPGAMEILLAHSEAVARKAVDIARSVPHLGADPGFVEEAAILHDIGMIMTDAPMLGCHGTLPYICHGLEGRKLLDKLGLERHALVCERHVGVGITASDIREKGFPLPLYDMVPLSIEEKLVCFADKFFSKAGKPGERTVEEVRASIARYGEEKAREFDALLAVFGKEDVS